MEGPPKLGARLPRSLEDRIVYCGVREVRDKIQPALQWRNSKGRDIASRVHGPSLRSG